MDQVLLPFVVSQDDTFTMEEDIDVNIKCLKESLRNNIVNLQCIKFSMLELGMTLMDAGVTLWLEVPGRGLAMQKGAYMMVI